MQNYIILRYDSQLYKYSFNYVLNLTPGYAEFIPLFNELDLWLRTAKPFLP